MLWELDLGARCAVCICTDVEFQFNNPVTKVRYESELSKSSRVFQVQICVLYASKHWTVIKRKKCPQVPQELAISDAIGLLSRDNLCNLNDSVMQETPIQAIGWWLVGFVQWTISVWELPECRWILTSFLSLPRFLLMMGVLFCCGAGFFIRRRMYPPPLVEEPTFNVSYTRQPVNTASGQRLLA